MFFNGSNELEGWSCSVFSGGIFCSNPCLFFSPFQHRSQTFLHSLFSLDTTLSPSLLYSRLCSCARVATAERSLQLPLCVWSGRSTNQSIFSPPEFSAQQPTPKTKFYNAFAAPAPDAPIEPAGPYGNQSR